MKTYVLYHGNCPDGFGAAFVAWLNFQERAEYIPVFYGKPMPVMEDWSDVLIVDFSYPVKELLALKERMFELRVLDHHATAWTELRDLAFCTFDMEKSGAVLAWEFFNPGVTPPLFIQYLQDRDLWKFALPLSREVSMAVRSYPFEFEVWSTISGMSPSSHNPNPEWSSLKIRELQMEGKACRRLTEAQVDIMAKRGRWMWFYPNRGMVKEVPEGDLERIKKEVAEVDFLGTVAPVANATVFFSEVGERLLELHPDAKFAGYYMDRANGKRQWGLRSRPEFDCSVVAKAFGGGGHKNAAGFETGIAYVEV